jgi:hypothetical protein
VPKCLIIFDEPKGGIDNFFLYKVILRPILPEHTHIVEKPNEKRKRSTLFVAGQIACDFSLY